MGFFNNLEGPYSVFPLVFDNIKDYQKNVNKFLEDEALKLEKSYIKLRNELKNGGDHERIDWEIDQLSEMYQEFTTWYPNTLRCSVIINSRTILEKEIKNMCAYYQRILKLEFGLSDMKGQGILNKSRLYVSRVSGVDLSEIPEWSNLNAISKLRNIIIHNQGWIHTKNEYHSLSILHDMLNFKDIGDTETKNITLEEDIIIQFAIQNIGDFIDKSSRLIYGKINLADGYIER